MFRTMVLAATLCCVSLSACGPTGGVASAGSTPAASPALVSTAANAAAAVADATLAPPSAISPGAATLIDDNAVVTAFEALDLAASAAETAIAFKPSLIGTPAAIKLADGLQGTRDWLKIASQAQRAQQATSYYAALEQARAALAGAKSALANLKAK